MQTDAATKTGTVKFYNAASCYGFIRTDAGPEIFFHISDCDPGADEPSSGDRVSFVVGSRNGKSRANNVKPISPEVSGRFSVSVATRST